MALSKDDCLFFYSRAKGSRKQLSNFWGCDISVVWDSGMLKGLTRTYPSAEHAYQANKALTIESADMFCVGCIFGSFEVFKRWPSKAGTKTTDMFESKLRTWRECPGIIAKMVSKVKPAVMLKMWGLQFSNEPVHTSIWTPIFNAKFPNGLPSALHLVEFDGKGTSKWGAKWVSGPGGGSLVGQNMMGELLMKHRLNLSKK